MKNIIIYIISIYLLILSCKSNPVECNDENYNIKCLTRFKGANEEYYFFIFNLCDSLLNEDTIRMSFYRYAHADIEDSYISFNLPEEYKLKKVTRQLNYFVTIWNEQDYRIVQYLQLKDINYTLNQGINLFDVNNFVLDTSCGSPQNISNRNKFDIFMKSKNIVFYLGISPTENILKQFYNVSKLELERAIDKELTNNDSYYDLNNKINEQKIWKENLDKYFGKRFCGDTNNCSIECFDIYITLFIEKDGININKVLEYTNTVGN